MVLTLNMKKSGSDAEIFPGKKPSVEIFQCDVECYEAFLLGKEEDEGLMFFLKAGKYNIDVRSNVNTELQLVSWQLIVPERSPLGMFTIPIKRALIPKSNSLCKRNWYALIIYQGRRGGGGGGELMNLSRRRI